MQNESEEHVLYVFRIVNAKFDFTCRIIHSKPLNMSAVHVLRDDQLVVVSHLIGNDQLPSKFQVRKSYCDGSKCLLLKLFSLLLCLHVCLIIAEPHIILSMYNYYAYQFLINFATKQQKQYENTKKDERKINLTKQ